MAQILNSMSVVHVTQPLEQLSLTRKKTLKSVQTLTETRHPAVQFPFFFSKGNSGVADNYSDKIWSYEGNIWISHPDNGLSVVSYRGDLQRRAGILQGWPSDSITCLFGHRQTLAVGTDRGLAISLDKGEHVKLVLLDGIYINAVVYCTSKWYVATDQGLYIFDSNFYLHQRLVLDIPQIDALAVFDGQVWAATAHSLCVKTPQGWQTKHYWPRATRVKSWACVQDRLFVGTDNGLWEGHTEGGHWQIRHLDDHPLRHCITENILDMAVLNSSTLVVASYRQVFISKDAGKTFEQLSTAPSAVTSLCTLDNGLILGSLNGITGLFV